jgi:hypothetical protein
MRTFIETLIPYLTTLFLVSWFVKIINFSIFDYYQTAFGKLGGLLLSTFQFYNKHEISDETNSKKRKSKVVNNVCGYIMLIVILISILLFFLY